MVATIQQIIGKINPKKYAENFAELLKEYKSPDKIPADKVKAKPLTEHKLVYDSNSETLEPIYFYILDLMGDFKINSEKVVDNFTSSPGSGHFSELGQKGTIMQQQATKILGDVNNVLRSVLNIVYDLRDFRTRLKHYDVLKSPDRSTQEAAKLSLKQIWLDRVDINKGNSSIKAMALGQGGFQTLLDAFLAVKDEKAVDDIDLNDRIKRILRPRILEFNHWIDESGRELKKRYEIEKTYLRSQVNSLKIYSRWAKPYLRAAQDLEMNAGGEREPALVKAFNTILLELTLFGTQQTNLVTGITEGKIPPEVEKAKNQKDFFSCFVIDFRFRGIPQRAPQQSHFIFGGRADVTFSSFALSKDEIEKVQKELGESDVADVMQLVEGMTTGSLEQLQGDIDEFLKEPEKPGETIRITGGNPFMALIGNYNESSEPKTEEKKDGKKEDKLKRPDNFIEKTYIRPFTEESAKATIFTLFDVYKKAHGMPSYT